MCNESGEVCADASFEVVALDPRLTKPRRSPFCALAPAARRALLRISRQSVVAPIASGVRTRSRRAHATFAPRRERSTDDDSSFISPGTDEIES
jgi:hypothetical protein